MRHSPKLNQKPNPSAVKAFKTIHRGRSTDSDQASSTLSQVRDVLNELHNLLADYSPTWFTETHYARTEEALRGLNRLLPSR